MATPLPPSLKIVVAPEFLQPSSFSRLLDCRLSAVHGLGDCDVLPESPRQILGDLVHASVDVRDGDGAADVEEEFARRVAAAEAALAFAGRSVCVPLRDAVGHATWDERVGRLRQWVARRVLRPNRGTTRFVTSDGPAFFGSEITLEDGELRLRGRVDLIRRGADGVAEVVDYKSGRLVGPDGEVLPQIRWQLRLYALLAEARRDGPLRLIVVGEREVEVSWQSVDRDSALATLTAVRAELPPGAALAAMSLASPGRGCRRCTIRHRCGAYRQFAEERWTQPTGESVAIGTDTWGSVVSKRQDADGKWTLVIRDAAGRRVHIYRLGDNHGVAELATDQPVSVFDLLPDQDLAVNGVRRHPTNFREHPTKRGDRPATTTALFA